MSRQDWSRLYRDWCVVGALGTVIAGFPTTPFGPLLLWAVILPAIASWLLRDRGRTPAVPEASLPTSRQRARSAAVVQARRRRPAAPPLGSRAA